MVRLKHCQALPHHALGVVVSKPGKTRTADLVKFVVSKSVISQTCGQPNLWSAKSGVSKPGARGGKTSGNDPKTWIPGPMPKRKHSIWEVDPEVID